MAPSYIAQRPDVPGSTTSLHFRNESGIADGCIAQTSNAQLVFYCPAPNDNGDGSFAWMRRPEDSNAIMTLSSDTGALDIYGDVTALHSSLSDRKYKRDIEPYSSWKEPLEALRPVEFTWTAETPLAAKRGKKDVGLIAQEVADAYPLAHDQRDVGHIVRLEKLIPLLVAATKDMHSEIAALTAKVEALTAASGTSSSRTSRSTGVGVATIP